MAKSTKSLDVTKINALFELERIGVKYEPKGDNEVKLKCPVHNDSTPSVNLNTSKNVWICHAASCGVSGDIVSLLAYLLDSSRAVILEDLSTRYELTDVKQVKLETIEKQHSKIWEAGPLLTALRARGVDDQMLRDARIGYHNGRITIPVFDSQGRAINIRRYLPGAPANAKMKNTKGYMPLALYQVNHTKFDTIWICGGEIKALVAGAMLKEHGIGAVSATAGEGSWEPAFTSKFKNKNVYICFDIDAGGIAGAKRVASYVAMAAKKVSIIELPLNIKKYPKGDLNDWIAGEGATIEDLLKAQNDATEFVLQNPNEIPVYDDNTDAEHVRLVDAINSKYIGKRISCDTIITAMDTTPYFIPRTVNVDCVVDGGKSDCCMFCPVRLVDPDADTNYKKMTVESSNPGILDMINRGKSAMDEALKGALHIPEGCKTSNVLITDDQYTIVDARLTPQLQVSGDNRDHITQEAFLVVGEEEIELNVPYTMSGRLFPHPATQQAIMLINKVEQGSDNLVSFTPSIEELQSLEILRPDDWTIEALAKKFKDRYDDLSSNVSRIYSRDEIHFALDLTYHSVLYFNFDNRRQNGWINCLMVGDSSQGKSETALRLIEHYDLGTKHDCKNASSAGLLGGLQQMGSNRWFITWGIIPMHDRRLVVMEELKGANVEVLGKLTDMRSSGIAEISKIEKRRAHARTRLIMISNPRSGRPLSAYNFGVEAIKELVGSQEDVRRFDIAVLPASNQIDSESINHLNSSRPVVEHKFTQDICKRTILWAWTRKLDQIRFDEGVEELCLTNATMMCKLYSESMPLCDKGTMRYKLARMAIAAAAMSFSTLKDSVEVILVRKCHIEYVTKFLNKEYRRPEFGYKDFSDAQTFSNQLLNPEEVERAMHSTKFPTDLLNSLLHSETISLGDIQDWCMVDREVAQSIVSLFVRKHALVRSHRYYVKTSEFINLLKIIKQSGRFNQRLTSDF